MDNAAKQKRSREGISRSGPAERALQAELLEVQRREKAERDQVYQRTRREKMRSKAEGAASLAIKNVASEVDVLSTRESSRVAQRILECIDEELRSCPSPLSRQDVLEKVLRHNTVWPLLPYYYPRPTEAKSIHIFLESFRAELQDLSIPFSNHMLSRKGALLDAAVGVGVGGVRALARVLGTKADNIMAALARKTEMPKGTSRFAPLQRHKRQDGTTVYTSQVVQVWWHENTTVSSNKKDVVNKDGCEKKGGLTHAKHYLTITQVLVLHHLPFQSFCLTLLLPELCTHSNGKHD